MTWRLQPCGRGSSLEGSNHVFIPTPTKESKLGNNKPSSGLMVKNITIGQSQKKHPTTTKLLPNSNPNSDNSAKKFQSTLVRSVDLVDMGSRNSGLSNHTNTNAKPQQIILLKNKSFKNNNQSRKSYLTEYESNKKAIAKWKRLYRQKLQEKLLRELNVLILKFRKYKECKEQKRNLGESLLKLESKGPPMNGKKQKIYESLDALINDLDDMYWNWHQETGDKSVSMPEKPKDPHKDSSKGTEKKDPRSADTKVTKFSAANAKCKSEQSENLVAKLVEYWKTTDTPEMKEALRNMPRSYILPRKNSKDDQDPSTECT